MYDKELVLDILHQILEATLKIQQRFRQIETAADFTGSPFGMERLDSICMLLIAIGESLKNIDKITDRPTLSGLYVVPLQQAAQHIVVFCLKK
ncbi:MAG: hypothetical protein V8K32_09030 [Candidatus Electrothrix gigas]